MVWHFCARRLIGTDEDAERNEGTGNISELISTKKRKRKCMHKDERWRMMKDFKIVTLSRTDNCATVNEKAVIDQNQSKTAL